MTTRRVSVVAAAAAALWTMVAVAGAFTGSPDAGDTGWLRAQLAEGGPLVIDVPAGVYDGPWVIDRPVHLRGHGRARLQGDGTTHVLAITAPDVIVDGFEIRGSGMDLTKDHAAIHIAAPRVTVRDNDIADSLHGVYVKGAAQAMIVGNHIAGQQTTWEAVDPDTVGPAPSGGEMCEVSLNQNWRGNGIHVWNSSGHLIRGNTISHTRDGIYFSFVSRSRVEDNTVEDARYGLHYMYSDDNQFDGNVFSRSAAGAALMFSKGLRLSNNRFEANRNQRAYGLLLQSVDFSTIEHNRITGNTLGLFLEGSTGNRVVNNEIVGNHVGIRVSDSSDRNVIVGNAFAGNLHGVETAGRQRTNIWTEDGRGNYWEGALRLDLDANGIADVPHRELDVLGGLRRELPQVALLVGSPGERLLRFVHARIPLERRSGITDTAPLMTRSSR